MTEKELRDSLKSHLAPACLPDHRKQALLAALREEPAPAPAKGDASVFRPNKFRTALIAALILTLLSATIAVATGFSGHVNFKGEPVENGQPIISDPKLTQRMYSYLNASLNTQPKDLFTHVFPQDAAGAPGLYDGAFMEVGSPEALAALLPQEVAFPRIPEGYAFSYGNVRFFCAADGAYELVHDEATKDGIIIRRYRIPEDKRVAAIANYILKAEGKPSISVSIMLEQGNRPFFNVNNAESVQTPDIPGMDNAILIVKPSITRLVMRRKLDVPLTVVDYTTLQSPQGPSTMELINLTIHLYSTDAPGEVLLSMCK